MLPIKDLIGDVWSGVVGWTLPDDVQGWNSDYPIFDDLVEQIRPRVAIEVGTWKGRSAIRIAKAMKKQSEERLAQFPAEERKLVPQILYCVDTWQGGIDHLLSDLPHDRMERENGFTTPHYKQFLVNCHRADVEDLIQPLPMPSAIAAKLLAAHKVVADLVYIDGDHTHDGAHADLVAYWPLVRPGGILFGDDVNFPGVHSAVARFIGNEGIPAIVLDHPFWIIRKPTG
jgi:hypothetical protein